MFLFIYLPQDLQAPSADRNETLSCERCLGKFYNAGPKMCPPPKKNGGHKMCKISSDFIQP